MSVDVFQIVLWGATALLLLALITFWWRQDVRERREAALARRWSKATTWNADRTARVVRVARLTSGVAWLEHEDVEFEVRLPDGLAGVEAGCYLHVTGWAPAARAAKRGRTVRIGAENVREAFPPETPAIVDRLMGRGDRPPGFVSRLFRMRGL